MNLHDHIFNYSPVGIIEEDWSETKKIVDKIKCEVQAEDVEKYFSSHSDVLVQIASSIKVKRVNPKAIQIFEAEHVDPQQTSMLETIYNEESFHVIVDAIRQILQGKKDIELSQVAQTFKGNVIYVISRMSFHPDDHDWSNIWFTIIDVTGYYRREVFLKDRFARVFYQGIGSFCMMNEHRIIVDANIEFCKMVGYFKSELIGKSVEMFNAGRGKGPQEDVDKLMSEKRDFMVVERELIKKGGTIFWAKISITVLHHEDGTIEGVLGQLIDIDAEKRLHAQEKVKIEEYKTLLDMGSSLFVVMDEDGKLEYSGKALLDLFDGKTSFISNESFVETCHFVCQRKVVHSVKPVHIFNKWFQVANCLEVGEKCILFFTDVTKNRQLADKIESFRSELKKN